MSINPRRRRPTAAAPFSLLKSRSRGAAGLAALALLLTSGCAPPKQNAGGSEGGGGNADSLAVMDDVARDYVRLVLSLGEHDEHYVDAYYGPEELREAAKAEAPDLATIAERAAGLRQRLAAVPADSFGEEIVELRHRYLDRQLEALQGRVRMLDGDTLSFDEESRVLYDAVSPHHPEADFLHVQEALEERLPGSGPLGERLETFREGFVIPRDRLDAVFQAAIKACRERTLAHLELPEEESFVVEYVTGQPWSAYNWYQGGFRSLIQVNTDLPIYIDRAIDLACHEGYPGHHVYNALLEKHLVRDRGWQEFAVYPLFSPQSLIAEGTANFGIEVAFPGDERVAFERDVLFPLAGLDPARAEEFYAVLEAAKGLRYAGNEAARLYLDGVIDADKAADWLVTHALSPRDRAEQRVRFIDRYRSYVINYNLGEDLVEAYVEGKGGTADAPERRWEVFTDLLSSPRLPSGLL
jgi:hypothetical protein